jgi:hypothetical protein
MVEFYKRKQKRRQTTIVRIYLYMCVYLGNFVFFVSQYFNRAFLYYFEYQVDNDLYEF